MLGELARDSTSLTLPSVLTTGDHPEIPYRLAHLLRPHHHFLPGSSQRPALRSSFPHPNWPAALSSTRSLLILALWLSFWPNILSISLSLSELNPNCPPWHSRSFKAGVPNLWDLVPDELRWSWCHDNRKSMHYKSSVLESSGNHPRRPSLWKNCLPLNRSLVPKWLGTAALKHDSKLL